MDEKKWTLKDSNGRIYGPFVTPKLQELIRKGVVDGDEFVAPHMTNDFKMISAYVEFYDTLIQALANESDTITAAQKEKELTSSISGTKILDTGIKSDTQRSTVVADAPTRPLKKSYAVPQDNRGKKKKKKHILDAVTIDLKSSMEIRTRAVKDNLVRIILIIGLFAVLVGIFINDDDSPVDIDKKVHLILPQKKGSGLSVAKQKERLRVAYLNFQNDSFKDYLKAQNILVSVLESEPSLSEAWAVLCLTYRELWEFSHQDVDDIRVLTQAVQQAVGYDPAGINGATCRAVQAIVRGQYENADAIIQSVLAEQPMAAVFYEMKGELLGDQKNYELAIQNLQKTQTLWAGWLKPFFAEAIYRKRAGDAATSAKILRFVLSSNPKHAEAKIQLGILELFDFQHPDQALDLISAGLQEDKVSRITAVAGYSALAAYYQRTDKKTKALEYAKRAFRMDPTNVDMRDLIVQIGGQGELNSLQSQEDELMALGEQYMKTGNYLAAQAEFKSAYEINHKNAQAALKASQSLWKIHQSLEAIEWAKKAIVSDPKFIEAYYEISDYYSQRYDFKVAINYLSQAIKQSPNHYLIYRGLAQLEYRRNNFKGAIPQAQKAIKLYDTDIVSHLILAKAHLKILEYGKAYQYAARALELEGKNFDVQETYAMVLAQAQSVRAAEEYLKGLISSYPSVAAYRFSLAKIYFNDQKYDYAAQTLEGVIQLEPENADALILLGNAYKATGDITKALKSYLQAGGLDPSNAEATFLIGILYSENDKTASQAIQYFQKVARVNPNYPLAYYYMGKAALKMGDNKKAIEFGTQEKRMNPNLPEAYILVGEAQMAEGNYLSASQEFGRAIKLQPNDASLYILAARSYRLAGQIDIAISMIKIAASKESGNPEVYKEQGAIFEKKGLIDEAATAYEKYLQLKPNAADRGFIQQKMENLSVGGG